MFELYDQSALIKFEQAELDSPSPRKETNARVIHVTREMEFIPGHMGAPVLCDFGSAVFADKLHNSDAQPKWYRCPEVILGIPWSHKIDIWNVGCMVILILFCYADVANAGLDLGYV
jgi:serine/threonine protein kinase